MKRFDYRSALWAFMLVVLIVVCVVIYRSSLRYMGATFGDALFLVVVDIVGIGAWISAYWVAHQKASSLWGQYVLIGLCIVICAMSIGWQIRIAFSLLVLLRARAQ